MQPHWLSQTFTNYISLAQADLGMLVYQLTERNYLELISYRQGQKNDHLPESKHIFHNLEHVCFNTKTFPTTEIHKYSLQFFTLHTKKLMLNVCILVLETACCSHCTRTLIICDHEQLTNQYVCVCPKEFKRGGIRFLFDPCVNAMGRRPFCPSHMEVSYCTFGSFGAICTHYRYRVIHCAITYLHAWFESMRERQLTLKGILPDVE